MAHGIKIGLLAMALTLASGAAFAESCKFEAGSKKLAGAALNSFIGAMHVALRLALEEAAADLAAKGAEQPGQVEAVAGGLEHEVVTLEGVALGPRLQLSEGNVVEGFLHHGLGRGVPEDDDGGEGVGVTIKSNDPTGEFLGD